MVDLIYPELSYRIMGVLFAVHNELGPNLAEKHYQRVISDKFNKEHMKFESQVKIVLEGERPIGSYYIDFLVENKIILEIKATPRISRNNILQILRYLRATGLELGLLVNFSRRELIYKRILRGFK